MVDSKSMRPDDLAASRIDFADFLASLDQRDRQVAETLATSETTSHTVKLFGLTRGRISQLRREFKQDWEWFHQPAGAFATV